MNGSSLERHQRQSTTEAAVLYSIISLVGLAISLLVGWYLLNSPAVETSTQSSARGYYIQLLVLGLSSAAFLFGALRSTAKLTGNHFGYAVDLGGPIVAAVLVVVGGFYLTRQPIDFPLNVRLRGSEPISDATNSSIWIDLDGLRIPREFSNLGEAIFPNTPSRFKNAKVPVQFQSTTYRLTVPRTDYEIPDNGVLYLDVVRVGAPTALVSTTCEGSPVVQLRNFGWSAFQAHNLEAADRAAKMLKGCDPNDWVAYNLFGAVAFYRQAYDQAVDYFEQATKLAPKMQDLYNNLADSLVELALQSSSDKKSERLKRASLLYESVRDGDFSAYKIARVRLFAGEAGTALNYAKSVPTSYEYDGGRGKARILEGAIYLALIANSPDRKDSLLQTARASFSEGVKEDRSFWTEIFVDGKLNAPEPFDAIRNIYGDSGKAWVKNSQ
jgi:tetratricopeptide (TPR) repeat protein/uncharacterized membrane protein YiaA